MLDQRPNAQLSTPSRIPVGKDSPSDNTILPSNQRNAPMTRNNNHSRNLSITVLLSSSTNACQPPNTNTRISRLPKMTDENISSLRLCTNDSIFSFKSDFNFGTWLFSTRNTKHIEVNRTTEKKPILK